MTSLICLICRCNLKDGRLVKENELFETEAVEAEILIRGGIAKPVEKPVAAPKPEPVKEIIPAKVVEETPTTDPDPAQGDPPEQKTDKRRKR